jgi:hypothetical protein
MERKKAPAMGWPALLLLCCGLAGIAVRAAHAGPAEGPSWGAIASMHRWYGYSFNHPTRDAAELAARAQCDRAAGRSGTCAVRAYFDRSCGALAMGNYGEWGAATGATAGAADKAAAGRCESYLPTEPCKVLVSVCSPR